MRYVFIINPTAGKENSFEKVSRQIHEFFKSNDEEYKIFKTAEKGDGTVIARKEAQKGGEVTVFSVGGEGTTLEVVNGIAGCPNASFGIIPYGTGNDFVKTFGTAEDFRDLKSQISGEKILIDAIKFEDMFVIDQCCCGMDAMVAANVGKFKKIAGGALAYNMSIIYTLFSKFKAKIKIAVDGKIMPVKKSLFMTCANAPFYGGGYKSAPTANPSDGKLNYSIIKTGSKIKAVSILGEYKKGEHIKKPYCEYGECSNMEIISDTELPIVLDGEIVYRKNAKFRIIKNALKFNLPAKIAEKFKTEVRKTATV